MRIISSFEIDESLAISELKALSKNARHYLQHTLRNGLQSIAACVEEGSVKDGEGCIMELSGELEKMGI